MAQAFLAGAVRGREDFLVLPVTFRGGRGCRHFRPETRHRPIRRCGSRDILAPWSVLVTIDVGLVSLLFALLRLATGIVLLIGAVRARRRVSPSAPTLEPLGDAA